MKQRTHATRLLAGLAFLTTLVTARAAVDVGAVAIGKVPLDTRAQRIVLGPRDLVRGEITLTGTAASSTAQMDSVEVSLDNGATWQPARGTLFWYFSFRPQPNQTYEVLVRGTDKNGETSTAGILDRITVRYERSRLRQRVAVRVADLFRVYTTENLPAFVRMFDEDLYRDRRGDMADLEDRVQTDFDLFTNMRVRYTIESVIESARRVAVRLYWNFTSDEHQTQGPLSGRDVFFFARNAAMKVVEVRSFSGGNAIFGFSNPDQPGQVLSPGGTSLPHGTTRIPSNAGFDFSAGVVSQSFATMDISLFIQGFNGELFGEGGSLLINLGDRELGEVNTINPPPNQQIINIDQGMVGNVIGIRTREGRYALALILEYDEHNQVLVIAWEYQPNGTNSF